jgi:hypothetical protein
MSPEAVTVPRNIWRFEVLLYTSLLLDTFTAAFQSLPDELSESALSIATLINALLILGFVFLVRLAALLLSLVSVAGEMIANGGELGSAVELLSAILTAIGLYFSFTGDARGWFDPAAT